MAVRTGHGTGRGVPRVEVLPADELPAGLPAPPRLAPERDAAGKLMPGPGTTELAREAARAKHEAQQLRRLLGLWEPEEGHEYQPYHRLAREWRDAHIANLVATVGGGEIGPGPASIVSTAAIQLGASRYLSDLGAKTGDAKMLLDASRLADSSRQSLLAAHELAAKEALARPKNPPASLADWLGVPSAPSTPSSSSSETKPPSESNLAPAIDKVAEPAPGGEA